MINFFQIFVIFFKYPDLCLELNYNMILFDSPTLLIILHNLILFSEPNILILPCILTSLDLSIKQYFETLSLCVSINHKIFIFIFFL